MSETRHILIICFGFPPWPGIGGRRWVKFAKYLAKAGYEVHVIRKSFPLKTTTEKSLWLNDIYHNNIHTYDVDCFELSLIQSENLFIRLLNRIKLFFLHCLSKGSPYDPALLWRANLHKKTDELVVQYGIRHIITTGAPFHILYDMALFKQKHPEIFLLCDYRDPWYGAHNYGMSSISPARLSHEHAMEATVIATADAITAPSDLFVNHPLRKLIMNKFYLLQHFADPDDMEGIDLQEPSLVSDNIVKIVYGGALYEGIEASLIRLGEILSGSWWQGPKVEIHIYSPDISTSSWVSQLSDSVFKLHPPINSPALFRQIVAAHASMIVLAEYNKNFHTTKFFELNLLPKPIFYIGPDGAVSDTIISQNIGKPVYNTMISENTVFEAIQFIKNSPFIANPSKLSNSLDARAKELQKIMNIRI